MRAALIALMSVPSLYTQIRRNANLFLIFRLEALATEVAAGWPADAGREVHLRGLTWGAVITVRKRRCWAGDGLWRTAALLGGRSLPQATPASADAGGTGYGTGAQVYRRRPRRPPAHRRSVRSTRASRSSRASLPRARRRRFPTDTPVVVLAFSPKLTSCHVTPTPSASLQKIYIAPYKAV